MAALMQGATWRRWSGYAVARLYELRTIAVLRYPQPRRRCSAMTPLFSGATSAAQTSRLLDRVVTRDVRPIEGGAGLVHALV
ncbi:MAG: hypothetical protein U0163_01770 [Gemmatimonadaceae bacterium]